MAINKTINKRTNSHGAMRNCIEYVLRQDKTTGKGKFCSGLCNGGIKGTGKLYQQRKVYRKNETVWMERKLDR